MARRIILCHHEHYDGNGYPNGLAGEDIPVEARIMTLADNYDALLSKRLYKEAFSYEQTREEIRSQSGSRFDPVMVEVMLENIERFESIYQVYSDAEEE